MNQSTTTPASLTTLRQGPPKWVKAAAGVGAVGFALWGIGSCASAMDRTEQRISNDAPAAPATPAVDANVLAFQAALSKQGVPFAYEPAMVDAARSACEALAAGVAPERLAVTAYNEFNKAAGREVITLGQAGAYVGASAGAFCPQHVPTQTVVAAAAPLAPAPPAGPATSFGNGTHVVGEDIAPGTYKANPWGTCYWARLSSTSDEGDIIANHLADGPTTVTIKKGDAAFVSNRCGPGRNVEPTRGGDGENSPDSSSPP